MASISANEAFGQNETVQPETNKPTSQPELTESFFTPLEYITIALAVINAVLAVLIYLTLRESRGQFSSINRPWLNVRIGRLEFEENEGIELIVKNHGKLPAKNINITFKEPFEKKSKVKKPRSSIHSLMPSQEQCTWLPVKTNSKMHQTEPGKGKLTWDYHVEITITFSDGKQDKKIIFEISYDTEHFYDNGPSIRTTFAD